MKTRGFYVRSLVAFLMATGFLVATVTGTVLYFTPKGHTIQARGVIPDILVAAGEGTPERHESDLPGALAASEAAPPPLLGRIDEDQCPAAGAEKNDRLLGCALAFFEAGSADHFLASRSAPKM